MILHTTNGRHQRFAEALEGPEKQKLPPLLTYWYCDTKYFRTFSVISFNSLLKLPRETDKQR